jgi:hypothetical protein
MPASLKIEEFRSNPINYSVTSATSVTPATPVTPVFFCHLPPVPSWVETVNTCGGLASGG